MIIKTKEFQDSARKILEAVDSTVGGAVNKIDSSISYSEILELESNNNMLTMKVSNGEYYVTVCMNVDTNETFRATIQANKFLKLISKVTTDSIELTTDDTSLNVRANGNYKFALVYGTNGNLIKLNKININNVTNEFDINTIDLQSIYKYNLKTLQMSGIRRPIHKMFYIDNKGAISSTSFSACVNLFDLPSQVKLLLSEKLVRLFKLFEEDIVHFSMGFDTNVNNEIVTKVKFTTNSVDITSTIINDSALMNTLKVDAIRNSIISSDLTSVVIDKNSLIETLDRLALFSKDEFSTSYTFLHFNSTGFVVYDTKKVNYEKINYLEISNTVDEYDCIINTDDLRTTLGSVEGTHVIFKFGNHSSVIIERPNMNIKNVVAECHLNN